LTFGTANLELIYYGIIDEKLVYAVMFANGENGEKLIEEAIKRYGANFKKKQMKVCLRMCGHFKQLKYIHPLTVKIIQQ